MNLNTIMILVGILIGVVLIIENMIVNVRAYVLIWDTYAWMLAVAAIGTGILIGYGLRGKMSESTPETEDDYSF